MAASAQMSSPLVVNQRRELLSDGTRVLSARILHWRTRIVVDQAKMATGEDVSTELLKVQLPTDALKKLCVAWRQDD